MMNLLPASGLDSDTASTSSYLNNGRYSTASSGCGSEVMTKSRSPRTRAGRGANEKAADRSSATSGHCTLKASSAGISHWKHEWQSIARCRRPVRPAASRCNSRSVVRMRGSTSSASASTRRPAVVSRAGRVRRLSSGVPKRVSRSRSWCDRADWVRCRRSAASCRLPPSRMAVSVSRWRISSMGVVEDAGQRRRLAATRCRHQPHQSGMNLYCMRFSHPMNVDIDFDSCRFAGTMAFT